MSDIADWLQLHGLEEHTDLFQEQQILVSDLPLLTEEDIKELGLPLGPRKRLMAALQSLNVSVEQPDVEESPVLENKEQSGAERRQLTVLFCDLVGSTELSRKLDPEDMQDINRAYQDMCRTVIERYDGYIARYMGDGVLAYFGYPRAHEDDAVRAVHTGLNIISEMNSINQGVGGKHAVELSVRVGIATGPVVVGDVVGKGASQESTAIGETPNFAARLQGLAEPNSIIIASETRGLAKEHFEYTKIADQRVKGFDTPLTVWRVNNERALGGRFDARHTAEMSSLVGRTEELALIMRRWEQVKENEGQVVLLSGEPGIGKSRIIQALRESLSSEDCTFLRYQCSPYHTNTALWPIIEQLERAVDIQPGDDSECRLNKLKNLLMLSSKNIESTLPYIAGLLSFDTNEQYPLPPLSPQELKDLTLQQLVEQIIGLASRQPVVMLYEDAHWSDPTSLELLGKIIQQLTDLPILLLVAFRPEFTPPWMDVDYVTGLSLNRMSRREVSSLATEISGGKHLPREVLDAILERTDGVPLYVEELTKLVLESEVLSEKGDEFILNAPLPTIEIPMTLKDSLMARLDRLGSARETAQVAAVIGRQFNYDILAAISIVSSEELKNALTELSAAGLLIQKGYPPSVKYMFKHALVRDAAYESLLKSRRCALHGALAESLESRHAGNPDEADESIAYHYSQANRPKKAVEYLVKSATKAAQLYSHREAIESLKQALEQIEKSSDESLRNQRADLHLRLAHSYYFIGNFKESLDIVSDRAHQKGLVSGTKLAAEWFFWQGHMGIRSGDPWIAEEAANRSIQEADKAEAHGAKGRALGVLVLHAHFFDSYEALEESKNHAVQSTKLLENSGEIFWQGMTEFYVGMVHIAGFLGTQFHSLMSR